MASSHNSLRDRQIRSIERMLNLNRDAEEASDNAQSSTTENGLALPSAPILTPNGDPIWKVLVFDDLGRDVISSVLRVNDLRTWGVTMHMHIAAQRNPIPDVPVIYLVQPTAANLKAITSDLSRGLYSPAYINFLSSIPRPLLEDFASQTAEAGTSENIAQFYDQYLDFIVAEPDLFSLGMGKENTYYALNAATTSDQELDAAIAKVVNGLFSVMVTMGVLPIIRCPKNAAAEMVAVGLDRKLRDHYLNSKDNLFSASSNRPPSATGTSAARPVLIILDRNVDLVPMLSHSWTYQSLVHDVLKMKLNRITVETPVDSEDPSKGTTKKSYDLNQNDFFWTKNASLPFPQVAENIDAELVRYKEDAAEVTKKTGAASIEDLDNDTSQSAQHLKAAITLLPELRERKATLDMHMNILAGILNGIKSRQLDSYYEMEENIMKQTKEKMLEIVNDPNKGKDPNDKLRLFIIWFLSTEQEVGRQDLEKFEEALKAAGAATGPLRYIKQVRATMRMTMMTSAPAQPVQQSAASTQLFSFTSGLTSRLTSTLKESGVGANFENLISGVKNFLPTNRDLTITKITESIMDPTTAPSSSIAKTENYLYFDPKNKYARGTMPTSKKGEQMPGGMGERGIQASFGQRRQGFSEAIVFTVGGGSMDEYGNLQEWAKRTGAGGSGAQHGASRRRVVYGSTELTNAEEFLKVELEKLGNEVP